jgi:hypothetical protein
MASRSSSNPNQSSALPITNNNYAYNQTVYSDGEQALSEHFETIGLGVVCTPFSSGEHVGRNTRTMANCAVESRSEPEEPRILLSALSRGALRLGNAYTDSSAPHERSGW